MDTMPLYSREDAAITLRLRRAFGALERRARPARIDNEREPLQPHADREREFGCP